MHALEDLIKPACPFAAWSAPAAGFVHIKMGNIARRFKDIRRLVHDDHSSRTEHRPDSSYRFIIHLTILRFLGSDNRNGGTTGNYRFKFSSIPHPTPLILDQRDQGITQRNFIISGLVDMTAHGIQLGPAALLRPERAICIAAVQNDPRDCRQRFDIIDDRRTAIETYDCREWRFES